MKISHKALYGTALAMILGCASANASIIYQFEGVTAAGGGNYDWKYIAQLSADQQLGSNATDFAVVYDFAGVVSATTSNVVAGLTLNTVIEATTTPQPANQSVTDNPSILNVDTHITGSYVPSTLTNIYTIDIFSIYGTDGTQLHESAQALKYSTVPGDTSNGTVTGNTAQIDGPTATPEPASMSLMATALLGLGFIRRRMKA